jgi:hypothetical protein
MTYVKRSCANGKSHNRSHKLIKQSTAKALPERLRISIGGHFGPCYEVTFKKGRLTYTHLSSRDSSSEELFQFLGPQPQCEEIKPSAKQWQNFRSTLNRLNVWRWQRDYPNSATVCDGVGWSAEIVYSDRSLLSSGSNCFPGRDGRALPISGDERDNTFENFCRAVARLIGREFH